MNKIPTAEQFLQCCDLPEETATIGGIVKTSSILIEFAQLHVEAALKAAADNAKIDESWENNDWESENPEGFTVCRINKDSILNAYPKELIQ